MTKTDFLDQPPGGAALTAYDRTHLKLYARLLDAEAQGADWREVAKVLFDLEADPEERHDRAGEARHRGVLVEGERRLRAILDPDAVDARAKRRQAELLASYGGREAALARGDLGFSPAPGTAAEIN